MLFHSTRGKDPDKDFASILMQGLAEDGGLFMPDYWPQVDLDEIKSKDLNHGEKLAGHVTQEFKLENDFIDSSGFQKFLASGVSRWMKLSENKDLKEFKKQKQLKESAVAQLRKRSKDSIARPKAEKNILSTDPRMQRI